MATNKKKPAAKTTKARKSATKPASKSVSKRGSKASAKKTSRAESESSRTSTKRRKEDPALTTETRRRLLKPKDQFVEVVEKTARALRSRREMRVPNVTVAKLESLTAKAVRAAKREAIMREQFEKKLRPLSDARLLAEDAAYRALLDVYAAVKLYARSIPAIGEEFAFLTEHLTFSRERPEPAPAPAPEPAS